MPPELREALGADQLRSLRGQGAAGQTLVPGRFAISHAPPPSPGAHRHRIATRSAIMSPAVEHRDQGRVCWASWGCSRILVPPARKRREGRGGPRQLGCPCHRRARAGVRSAASFLRSARVARLRTSAYCREKWREALAACADRRLRRGAVVCRGRCQDGEASRGYGVYIFARCGATGNPLYGYRAVKWWPSSPPAGVGSRCGWHERGPSAAASG